MKIENVTIDAADMGNGCWMKLKFLGCRCALNQLRSTGFLQLDTLAIILVDRVIGGWVVRSKPWLFDDEKRLKDWFTSGTKELRVLAFSFDGKYSENTVYQKLLDLGLLKEDGM